MEKPLWKDTTINSRKSKTTTIIIIIPIFFHVNNFQLLIIYRKLAILAQARLPQLLQACKVFSTLTPTPTPHQLSSSSSSSHAYCLQLASWKEDQQGMKVLSVLEEFADSIPLETMKTQKDVLIVQSIKNEEQMKQLLRAELYPPISFTVQVR